MFRRLYLENTKTPGSRHPGVFCRICFFKILTKTLKKNKKILEESDIVSIFTTQESATLLKFDPCMPSSWALRKV